MAAEFLKISGRIASTETSLYPEETRGWHTRLHNDDAWHITDRYSLDQRRG